MGTTKIHCDILDIFGMDWSQVTLEQRECIIHGVHNLELQGDENDLYGFVGTVDLDGVVGGFFMVQFPTELLSYDLDKTANRETTKPAERVFFVLLPKYGKILLQIRHFEILPIDMDAVCSRLQSTIAKVLKQCKVGPVVSLSPTTSLVGRAEVIEYYKSSRKVHRLKVQNPNPKQIPEGIAYYNPQRERNEIIRDSRLHDYPKLKSVDIAAKEGNDLRETHLGKDLVYAVTETDPFIMEFEDKEQRRRILRRNLKKTPLEFRVDVDSDQLSCDTLRQVLEILDKEVSLDITVGERSSTQQLGLFTDSDELDDYE